MVYITFPLISSSKTGVSDSSFFLFTFPRWCSLSGYPTTLLATIFIRGSYILLPNLKNELNKQNALLSYTVKRVLKFM